MKLTPSRIFTVGVAAVAVTFAFSKWSGALSADELSAVYTGLGFAGLVATFYHEREQAEQRDKEQAQLFNQMRAQAKATCHAARVAAITARLENERRELKFYNQDGIFSETININAKRTELRNRIRLLEKELEKASETIEIL